MRAAAGKSAEGALALLDTISNPERTKEALENFQKEEFQALSAIKDAHKEKIEIKDLRKDLTERESALKATIEKHEADYSSRSEKLAEENAKQKQSEILFKKDREKLNKEQNAFVQSCRTETDRIENHKRSLSVREKKLESLKASVEKQEINAKAILDEAKALKATYDSKIIELNRIISD